MSSDLPKTPEEWAEAAVKVLDIPGGSTSRRPVHTVGIGARGNFVASDVAKQWCIAEIFKGEEMPVTLRFSNGKGVTMPRDGWNDTRGLAVRFHPKEGPTTDLVAMTLPEFFTPTPETFLEFAKATFPQPVVRETGWQKLLAMLRLTRPLPDPHPGETTSGDLAAVEYADTHPHAELCMFHGVTLGAPVSYARAAYHAVHTFIAVAPDGTRRPVRFHWIPVAGVLNVRPEDKAGDLYLQQELITRLEKAPATFLLMMAIGEVGDDFDDPSRSWPPHRVRVMMGTLTVTEVMSDQDGERLSFNPWNLAAGIEPSADPILELRRGAYEFSRNRRGGLSCPFAKG